ncbi:hypothetical protein K493DRAFT_306767 [Basidiobolus meristosporus CBS 931.73]|uniref:SCP domain-containing protein n=1 Tax=Basidiobolus meristosporus CBS 931.73 TaxID=1314790 RepID=A0A1Y1XQV9_9FUNG|nr:hypothetical protein K493DRAFT_306767 [Basidiobolus meristosporus CBS 931.73]|eukprot:ORX88151.1 hypothetical protein K493DRAFT_306767 [Basidiobolus meristosporus CBS 931.73]
MRFFILLTSLVASSLLATTVSAFSEARLICLVNRERVRGYFVSRHLGVIPFSSFFPTQSDLNEDAHHHSESQANRRQMTHARSDRPDMGDVARSRGYNYRTRAENVAAGDRTEESVVYKWMHSEVSGQLCMDELFGEGRVAELIREPEMAHHEWSGLSTQLDVAAGRILIGEPLTLTVHRRNILTPSFTHAGSGFDPRGNYWTMEFLGMDPSRINFDQVPVCP